MTPALHIIPMDDLRDHEPSADCWCRPTLDDDFEDEGGDVYLHHALDGRELYESGERKLQ
jgi:hypothetical protein